MTLYRKNIKDMAAYVPGEQPTPGAKVIKLNTNENPYPPSPKAMEALRQFDGHRLRLYSDPASLSFCHAAAKVHGVPCEWILAGNGSDDLLSMVVLACAEPGRKIVYPTPTYVLYRTLAQMQSAPFVEVPYGPNFELPLEQLIRENGAVTFIARPNSPSGTSAPLEQIEALARGVCGLVVLDEAYADFSCDNGLGLVKKYENVVALRTLSKGYSLAGLRLGYAIGNPSVLAMLNKVKDSYPVDAVACAVGAAAIEDQAYMTNCACTVRFSRAKLLEALAGLGFRVWPSESNFVLAQAPQCMGNCAAQRIYDQLKRKGILVRYFKEPLLEDKLRITVGTDEQNTTLIEAIGKILES
jgi:histidinol-phosphate aminotransferase